MAKMEEEITCDYCDSEFTVTYDDNKTYGKIGVCPFCGEHLQDDYIEGEDDEGE